MNSHGSVPHQPHLATLHTCASRCLEKNLGSSDPNICVAFVSYDINFFERLLNKCRLHVVRNTTTRANRCIRLGTS